MSASGVMVVRMLSFWIMEGPFKMETEWNGTSFSARLTQRQCVPWKWSKKSCPIGQVVMQEKVKDCKWQRRRFIRSFWCFRRFLKQKQYFWPVFHSLGTWHGNNLYRFFLLQFCNSNQKFSFRTAGFSWEVGHQSFQQCGSTEIAVGFRFAARRH